jgi:hypothetical protein
MTDDTRDADLIERDIERTQDAIGETVEKIEEKLSPKEVTRSLLGDDGQEIAREIIHMARDNPIPVAMIAVGTIWLFASSNSPMIRRWSRRLAQMAGGDGDDLRSRRDEPAPIGPPGPVGESYDRARSPSRPHGH